MSRQFVVVGYWGPDNEPKASAAIELPQDILLAVNGWATEVLDAVDAGSAIGQALEEMTELGRDDYEEETCDTEGCFERLNDGEGWDGYCGNCADALEAELPGGEDD